MKCPFCKTEGFEILQDEVDIGVGVQTHIGGGQCNECGEISCCVYCVRWEPPEAESGDVWWHEQWCKYRENK